MPGGRVAGRCTLADADTKRIEFMEKRQLIQIPRNYTSTYCNVNTFRVEHLKLPLMKFYSSPLL